MQCATASCLFEFDYLSFEEVSLHLFNLSDIHHFLWPLPSLLIRTATFSSNILYLQDNMDQLVAQVKQLGSTLDDAARRKLRLALRDLAYSMEDDDDIVHRIAYLVWSSQEL